MNARLTKDYGRYFVAILKHLRMGWMGLFAGLLLAMVYYLSPQQFPIVLHKLSLVALAGVFGYWLDRHLFPYARPHLAIANCRIDARAVPLAAGAMIRRAIIVAACLIAVAVGL